MSTLIKHDFKLIRVKYAPPGDNFLGVYEQEATEILYLRKKIFWKLFLQIESFNKEKTLNLKYHS